MNDENVVQLRAIKVERFQDGQAVIVSGLKAEDRVVLSPHEAFPLEGRENTVFYLSAGMKVNPKIVSPTH